MTMHVKMAAAHAAIRKFKEERMELLANEPDAKIHTLAAEANRQMHAFLRDALEIYRETLENVEFERRRIGHGHPKLRELEQTWSVSEETARQLFEYQLDAVREAFLDIFKKPDEKPKRKKRRKLGGLFVL